MLSYARSKFFSSHESPSLMVPPAVEQLLLRNIALLVGDEADPIIPGLWLLSLETATKSSRSCMMVMYNITKTLFLFCSCVAYISFSGYMLSRLWMKSPHQVHQCM